MRKKENNNIVQKLSIGTAQFGMDYGITNKKGKCSYETIVKILVEAYEKGIRSLDTAKNYGNSEKVIGEALKETGLSFSISTKITSKISLREIKKAVEDSLVSLNKNVLDSVLFHDSNFIQLNDALMRYKCLCDMKKEGLIKNIGVSLYTFDELNKVINLDGVDVVQVPLNLFDQTFLNKDVLEISRDNGIKLEARSIFLQGILLSTIEKLPKYFLHHNEIFKLRDCVSLQSNASLLDVSLGVIKRANYFHKFILGVTSLKELKQIIKSLESDFGLSSSHIGMFSCSDRSLIDPRNWPSVM